MSSVTHNTTPLFVAGSPEAPRALLIIQEAFGVNDHIRDVTQRFAAEGYYVVAPELFHRTGSPEVPYDDFPSAMEHMGALNADDISFDLRNAAAFLNEAGYPTESIGCVGYCMGGTVTFVAATMGIVGAAAPYYGSGLENGRFGFPGQIALAPSITCPVIGFYGDLDTGIPIDQVEMLRTALAATDFDTQVVRFAEAHHGFHCEGRPDKYNADASAEAYRQTLDFFATHLAPR
jgi:carboxymethylenebutenolidase